MNPNCEQFRTALLSACGAKELDQLANSHQCEDNECAEAMITARELGPKLETWSKFDELETEVPSLAAGVLLQLTEIADDASILARTTGGSLRASTKQRPFEWTTAAACGLACCLTLAFGVIRGDSEKIARTSANLIGIPERDDFSADPKAIAFAEKTEQWLGQTSVTPVVDLRIEASLEKSADWLATNFGPLARSLQQVGEQADSKYLPPTS